MRLRARGGAAKFAAGICVVFGLAVSAGGAAADEAPASRTPLADTGLWTPPVLNSDEFVEIPADEGLAAFYGIYDPISTNQIRLFDRIVLGKHDVYYYGADGETTRDFTIQYKVLHQGENYVFVRLREFPFYIYNQPHFPEVQTAFGFIVFEKRPVLRNYWLLIADCGYTRRPLSGIDNFDQTPERDIADFIESGADAAVRKNFENGEAGCGGGWAAASSGLD